VKGFEEMMICKKVIMEGRCRTLYPRKAKILNPTIGIVFVICAYRMHVVINHGWSAPRGSIYI